MDQITLSQTIIGYTLAAQARRLSSHTLADYDTTFRKFTKYLAADPALADITRVQVQGFLVAQSGISKKTLLNMHTGLSALWTWAVRENITPIHILRQVERPKPEIRAMDPFTESDVRALLASLEKSTAYARLGKRECQHSLDSAPRNRAIILLLLDTGLRASELCELTTENTDLQNRKVLVLGKGAKERIVPFSASTGQSIWRYFTARPTPQDNTARAFLTESGHPMRRDDLIKLFYRIGKRAGIPNCYPHRLRHTFAITFLRNGGNAYALQLALGHSTMEMVRRYLAIVQSDVEAAHRQASPVSNWRL